MLQLQAVRGGMYLAYHGHRHRDRHKRIEHAQHKHISIS